VCPSDPMRLSVGLSFRLVHIELLSTVGLDRSAELLLFLLLYYSFSWYDLFDLRNDRLRQWLGLNFFTLDLHRWHYFRFTEKSLRASSGHYSVTWHYLLHGFEIVMNCIYVLRRSDCLLIFELFLYLLNHFLLTLTTSRRLLKWRVFCLTP
jgi:hypothetical protein